MPSYGGGDALRRTVEVLVQSGGTGDIDQIREAMTQLQAVLVTTADVMRRQGSSAEEMAAAMRPTSNDIASLNRLLKEFEQNAGAAADADQRAAQLIEEAEEGIARATHMAMAAEQDRIRAMDAAGGKAEWLARQDVELAHALQGLAAAERTAEAATDVHVVSMVNAGGAIGRTGAAADDFGRRMGGAARGVLELSRGVEDFTVAGPLGVLNNIPSIAYDIGVAFGASAIQVNLVAAGVSLVGTTAYIAYQNWDKLMGALDPSRVQSEAAAMEALGKQTRKTADETDRLNAYKEKEAAIKALQSGKTDEQEAQAKGVQKAVEGPDERKIADALAATSRDLLEFTSNTAKKAGEDVAKAEKLAVDFMEITKGRRLRPEERADVIAGSKDVEKARETQRDELVKAARDLMGSAKTTTGGLDLFRAAVEQNRAAFPKGLAEKLEAASPEGQKAAKELEEETKAAEKAIADRLHRMVRDAHDALADADVGPADKAEKVKALRDELDRSGLVGEGVRRAREQLQDAQTQAEKQGRTADKQAQSAFGQEVEKNAREAAQNLVQQITRAMADKSSTPDAQQKVIAATLNRARATLGGAERERVEDAATNAREQLGNRGIARDRATGKTARESAADDIRDRLRDIGLSDLDAGAKQRAIRGVGRGIPAVGDVLGPELAADLTRQVTAAFVAAGRQGAAQLRKDAAAGKKAEHEGLPTTQIAEAAQPMVQQAVAQGIPHARAQQAVVGRLEQLLRMNYSLVDAEQQAWMELEAFVLAEMGRMQARQRSGRLSGRGSLQQAVVQRGR